MDKKIGTFVIIYFIIGIIFASIFAIFYHWPPLSFFSPGFFVVAFTWPIQLFGFISDFQIYGLTGKTLI